MSLEMVDILHLLLALSAGALLGSFYFGALWLTIQRLTRSRQPALLVFGSYVVRMEVTLVGFSLVMDVHWERLIACLVGLILARQLLMHRLQPTAKLSKPVIGD